MNSYTRTLAGTVVGLFAAAAFAGTAHAGEITGNGKSLKNDDGSLNGASICAFSGYNDTYTGGEPDHDGFTRTQSWGQIPHEVRKAMGTSSPAHPGNSCNPTTGFEE